MSEKTESFFERIFGENWDVKLWGFISGLAFAIAAYPDSVAFLPDDIEGYVKGIAGLFSLYSGGQLVNKLASAQNVEKKVESVKAQVATKVSKKATKSKNIKPQIPES